MSEDDIYLELSEVFKELHERIALIKSLIECPTPSFQDLISVTNNVKYKVSTLEFDLRVQADKYKELYQKF